MSDAIALLDRALDHLSAATVASCTCGTKTPDPAFHIESCRYRLIALAIDYITAAKKDIKTEQKNES